MRIDYQDNQFQCLRKIKLRKININKIKKIKIINKIKQMMKNNNKNSNLI